VHTCTYSLAYIVHMHKFKDIRAYERIGPTGDMHTQMDIIQGDSKL
jgi:hypothetical protein